MIEQIRSELCRVLDAEAGDIAMDADLVGIGLHSLALMRLIGPLSQLAGARVAYADLARRPTLAAWNTLLWHLKRGQEVQTRTL